MKTLKLVKQFVEENDLSETRTTLTSIALRDAIENPDLYKNSNISEVIIELQYFLERIDKSVNE